MTNPSNDQVKAKRSLKETFWPNVSTVEEARKTARYGMWAAYIGGGLTVLIVIIAFLSNDVQNFIREALEIAPGEESSVIGMLIGALLEGMIFLGLGFAIGKMSRVAAVLAPMLFLLDKIIMPSGNFIGIIVFLWLYALGIRGTFAWHRLTHK